MKQQRATKQHTKGRRQRRRQTKRNYKRGGAPFHGSVEEFIELARRQSNDPLIFFAKHYANQTDDNFLYNLIIHLIRNKQINETQTVIAIGILLDYDVKFSRSIIRLLRYLKPIQDMLLLNKLYEDVFQRLKNARTKEGVFKTIRITGHVPLNEEHKRNIYLENYNSQYSKGFKKILPAAKTETANTIYSLGRREIELPADNIIELHSYLDAAANDSFNRQMRAYNEEMDAEEAAELENVDNGDY